MAHTRYGPLDHLDRMAKVGDAPRRTPVPSPRAEVELVEDRTPAMVQRRDPTAATRALRFVSPGRAAPPDWDAATAFQRAYYVNVVVYACFQAIANTIAGLEFRAGPDPTKPADFNLNAPLARLLGPPPGGPNPNMDAETLWYFLITQYLVTGRLAAEIEVDKSDNPVALWPLVSGSLMPVPTTSGVNWFSEFIYGRPGDQRRLPTDRVLYAWQPSGADFRQPESAIQAAHLEVNIAVMQSRYDFAFLKNDARPAAIVVTEEFEDDDAAEAFKSSWEGRHVGPDNAGRTAYVESKGGEGGVKGAVDVIQLGFSPKDAQAAQRHSDAMQRIAVALGVPWSRLDASGRTFDNASEEDKIWWQQRLIPLIRRLQSAVNIQLAPRVGSEVGWFDLSKIPVLKSKPEPVTQKATADVLVSGRIMTVNEARADYGLPPLDGFDELEDKPEPPPPLMPFAPAVPALPTAQSGEAAGAEEGDRGAPEQPPHRSMREPTVEPVSPTPDELQARRATLWRAVDRTVRNLEATFERGMRRFFARQARSVIARLEAKRGRQAAGRRDARGLGDEIFDPVHWRAETTETVRDYLEAIAAAGGARVADRFDLAFDVAAPFAQTFIANRANQLAGRVTDTTYGQIQDALVAGVAEGEGIPDLSKRIMGVFDEATKNRATMIARTETISAYNGSASLAMTALGNGVVGGQQWIATQDSRTRETHSEMDGEVVPVGEAFSNGLAYPGDPSGEAGEVINCRCTLTGLTPDEMSDSGRSVSLPVARALLAALLPHRFDERVFRAACEVAA